MDAAEKELAQLQHAHAAHTLRGTLAIGQPCPVCARKVTKVPGGEPLEDVERVRRSAVNGRARLTKVQAQEQRAALEVAAADETLRATTSTWEELRSEVERVGAELRRVLPTELHDDARWPQTLQARTDAAAAGRDAAERDVGAARGLVAEVAGQIAGIEGELRTLPAQIDERREALRSLRERCEETEQVVSVAPRPPAGPGRCQRNWRRSTFASARPRSRSRRPRSPRSRREIGCSRRRRPSPMPSAKPTPRRSVHGRACRSARSSPVSARRSSVPWKRSCPGARTSRRPLLPSSARSRMPGLNATRSAASWRPVGERATTSPGGSPSCPRRVGALDRQLDDQRQRQRVAKDALDVMLTELSVRLAETALTLAPGDGDEHDAAERLWCSARRATGTRPCAARRNWAPGSRG